MSPQNPIPDEVRRLQALARYGILDTPAEGAFDDLTALAAQICEVPISLVSLVDAQRQWFKSKHGFPGSETSRQISFCAHAIQQRGLFIVPDATKDERFSSSPLVTEAPFVRFYAGMPLVTPEGEALGSLCVIDHVPRELTALQAKALEVLSQQVMAQIELRRQMREVAGRERLLDAIFDSGPDCVMLIGRDGTPRMVNRAGLEILEAESLEQIVPAGFMEMLRPEDRAGFATAMERGFAGQPATAEFQITGLRGATRWLEMHSGPLRDELGEVTGFLGISHDITNRKRTEALVKIQKDALELIARGAPLERTLHLLAEFVEANGEGMLASFLLLDADGTTLRHLAAPSLPDAYVQAINGVQIGECVGSCGTAAFRGEAVFVEDIATDPLWKDYASLALTHGLKACWSVPVLDGQDQVVGTFACYFRTPRLPSAHHRELLETIAQMTAIAIRDQRAEDAIRDSEARSRAIVDFSPVGIYMTSPEGHTLYINRAIHEQFGVPVDQRLGQEEWMELVHPEDRPQLAERWRRFSEGLDSTYEGEYRFVRSDGLERRLHVAAAPIRAGDRLIGYVGATVDVTERRRAEEALRLSEAQLREAQERTKLGSWERNLVTGKGTWSAEMFRLHGLEPAADPPSFEGFLAILHPDDRERVREINRVAHQSDQTMVMDYRTNPVNGPIRNLSATGQLVRDIAGHPVALVGTTLDVTERHRLEEQLRHSQKMEAIGRLAGGVAHDFNNILGAMIVQADVASLMTDLPPAISEFVEDIKAGAERAANLTRQLLAFSRRQVMQTREMDLNEVITLFSRMLRRILGEDVRLQLDLQAGALMVYADAGMVEQLLMNLVVNSRDAMPQGGVLTIETSERVLDQEEADRYPEAVPGRYACLRVADTGCGIAVQDLARIFDPFFTTKEAGKGTGLGLATVFGIVRQHHGVLTVESQIGEGATFQVLLPRCLATGSGAALSRPEKGELRGGTETILVVEDEAPMRRATCMALKQYGYRIIEAANGREAVKIWKNKTEPVHLLLTDLVMPEGVSGSDLAAQLRLRDPKLRVIFTSGYSSALAGQELTLLEGQNFLQKPATLQQMLETVRRCLDQ